MGDPVLEEVLKLFLSLFVIMGPFASIPVFLSVTKGMGERQKARAVSYAVGIAAAVLFAFLVFGQAILSVFMINFQSLKIAGGIILSILGIELVLGLSFARRRHEHSPAIVLIGTPLLTGPGVIVTTVIFVQGYGHIITAIAAFAALGLSWLTLWCSRHFVKLLGKYGVEIVSRVTGILLVAVAVEFVVTGVKAIV
jgi:multiple antibiotic resistance protein